MAAAPTPSAHFPGVAMPFENVPPSVSASFEVFEIDSIVVVCEVGVVEDEIVEDEVVVEVV